MFGSVPSGNLGSQVVQKLAGYLGDFGTLLLLCAGIGLILALIHASRGRKSAHSRPA